MVFTGTSACDEMAQRIVRCLELMKHGFVRLGSCPRDLGRSDELKGLQTR
jgi:hypothetical protein